MIKEKTDYGIIHKNLAGETYHVSFSNTFNKLVKNEAKIAMSLIDRNYKILSKKIYYVGGKTHKGVDTWVNLESQEYQIEPYTWVEHGVWKQKFKIKKKK